MEKQDNGEIRANEAGQEADEAVRAAGAPRRGMDRRNFLKGAALSALGVASAGALAACAPQQNGGKAADASDGAKAGEDEPFKAEETVDADVVVVGCRGPWRTARPRVAGHRRRRLRDRGEHRREGQEEHHV